MIAYRCLYLGRECSIVVFFLLIPLFIVTSGILKMGTFLFELRNVFL